MKNLFKYFGAIFVAIVVSGCGGATVYVADQSNLSSSKNVQLSDVENAIKAGANRRGWRIKKESEGLLSADITVQSKYPVSVTIPYTNKGYKIEYKDTQNLNFDPATKTIHKSYNKWVRNLENDINFELSKIGVEGFSTPALVTKSSEVVE